MKELTENETKLLNTPPSQLNIEQQFERKRIKQRIDQDKYRLNKTDTSDKKNEFLKKQKEYIKTYRNNKKIELFNFIENKKTDLE